MQGFINRSARVMLGLLTGVVLVGAASCGGGGGVPHESDGARKKDAGVPTVSVVYRNGYQITVQGKDMESVAIEFTGGLTEVYMLSKQGKCFSASKDGIDQITVSSKGGDYWYFDGMGNPIEDDQRQASGLLGSTLTTVGKLLKPAPVIKVSCTGGPYTTVGTKTTSALGSVMVNVTSNTLYSGVKVATSTDQVLTYSTSATYSGSYDTQTTATVAAIQVTLATDGSKWYFDSAGNVLPADSKWYQDLD
jgi:hypothetical protein